MKKNLFLASALVMGMMSSCSSDVENVTVPGADKNLQPVELSIASPSVIVSPETRGIGTVGSISGTDENVWNGEELYVNMMCYYKDGAAAWEVSKWTKVDAGGLTTDIENFNNVKVNAPASDEGDQGALVITPSAEGRYYPPTASKHQFFAYHIDDAIIGSDYTSPTADGNPEVVDDPMGKTRKVYFKIDGSQDLMMGEAVAKSDAGEYEDVLFSAKSARGGVIPNLVMKHLLTRFTFDVKTDKEGNNLKVEKIIVKSKDRGTMCVAYAAQPAQLLEFEDDVTGLELKEKGAGDELQTLTPVALKETAETIGEALMVAPGEESYDITIVASQTVGGGQTHTFSYDSKIKLTNGPALAGSSYKVNITLYGLQEIKIEAQLTGWNQADDEINLTPGEEF